MNATTTYGLTLGRIDFPTLSQDDNRFLNGDFEKGEIKEVVSQYGEPKA